MIGISNSSLGIDFGQRFGPIENEPASGSSLGISAPITKAFKISVMVLQDNEVSYLLGIRQQALLVRLDSGRLIAPVRFSH